jgi:hypothetical protein
MCSHEPNIQKIYEVDPLICPKCQGRMKVISFIEDREVTRPPRLSSRWRAGQKDLETLRDLVSQKETPT